MYAFLWKCQKLVFYDYRQLDGAPNTRLKAVSQNWPQSTQTPNFLTVSTRGRARFTITSQGTTCSHSSYASRDILELAVQEQPFNMSISHLVRF